MANIIEPNIGPFTRACCSLKALPGKLWSKVVEIGREAKKLGQEDPRRIIHSCKVGLAITLVSLFYYFEPLYDGFGVSAMWAVITVVVVFEFSVGATLGKGVNRGMATLVAGSLGVGAHRLAAAWGERFEPIILGIYVFLFAAVVTFVRFFPRMKARYDYGLVIFILTFCLISVSGYRNDEVLDMACTRLSTILIGGSTSVVICIFIYPAWAGDDLHNQLASNMEKLATFLQEYGAEYFKTPEGEQGQLKDNKALLQGYESVLHSKGTEESLANFAKWEPRHGWFRYRHPWEQYLKVGARIRQCAYTIEALNGYISSAIQTPHEIRAKIQESCTKMSAESSYALKELALSMKTMTRSSTADSHILKAKLAAEKLKSLLKTSLWEETDVLQIIPSASVASLLIDVVTCTANIAESVHDLSCLVRFKDPDDVFVTPEVIHQGRVHQSHNHTVTIGE